MWGNIPTMRPTFILGNRNVIDSKSCFSIWIHFVGCEKNISHAKYNYVTRYILSHFPGVQYKNYTIYVSIDMWAAIYTVCICIYGLHVPINDSGSQWRRLTDNMVYSNCSGKFLTLNPNKTANTITFWTTVGVGQVRRCMILALAPITLSTSDMNARTQSSSVLWLDTSNYWIYSSFFIDSIID